MSVLEWLLDSDPAIRWQVLRDLTDARVDMGAAERRLVASEGWGAALLALQAPDGSWGGTSDSTGWDSTNVEWNCLLTLLWLRDFGIDPADEAVAAATALTAQNVTWKWWDNRPFFHGEVEPCINGRVLALAGYFGHDSGDLVGRLLGEQMADGGWNCEQENGSTRGSFHSTINVLEGVLAFEERNGATAEITDARLRGQEYLLERRMLYRLSTGAVIDPAFTQLSFPYGYHYDVLRGLDYLRAAGVEPDERTSEAVAMVARKRRPDGRWNLENPHPDQLEIDACERDGDPSRWITLRALRVLRWAGFEPPTS
jgi:hypothetical protein